MEGLLQGSSGKSYTLTPTLRAGQEDSPRKENARVACELVWPWPSVCVFCTLPFCSQLRDDLMETNAGAFKLTCAFYSDANLL